MSIEWLQGAVKPIDKKALEQALAYQNSLTKPPGSLGRLEELAASLCAMQGTNKPELDKVQVVVFAGDHGIADEGVSAFPQVVTREMVKNFATGGAAISVLARQLEADLEVVNAGVCFELDDMDCLVNTPVALGTANFSQQAAMTEEQLSAALTLGYEAVERAIKKGAKVFVAGEMGIANTSSATALACALLELSPQQVAGPGTGLDEQGVAHKVKVIEKSLAFHGMDKSKPVQILQYLGGLEIAAMVGAYLRCAQQGLPVVVDGFIASAAALVASRIQPQANQWWFFAHASAEPGHAVMMQALEARPLLDLGMRLGEGSGAATAVVLMRLACSLHNEMATFEQAGVSEGA